MRISELLKKYYTRQNVQFGGNINNAVILGDRDAVISAISSYEPFEESLFNNIKLAFDYPEIIENIVQAIRFGDGSLGSFLKSRELLMQNTGLTTEQANEVVWSFYATANGFIESEDQIIVDSLLEMFVCYGPMFMLDKDNMKDVMPYYIPQGCENLGNNMLKALTDEFMLTLFSSCMDSSSYKDQMLIAKNYIIDNLLIDEYTAKRIVDTYYEVFGFPVFQHESPLSDFNNNVVYTIPKHPRYDNLYHGFGKRTLVYFDKINDKSIRLEYHVTDGRWLYGQINGYVTYTDMFDLNNKKVGVGYCFNNRFIGKSTEVDSYGNCDIKEHGLYGQDFSFQTLYADFLSKSVITNEELDEISKLLDLIEQDCAFGLEFRKTYRCTPFLNKIIDIISNKVGYIDDTKAALSDIYYMIASIYETMDRVKPAIKYFELSFNLMHERFIYHSENEEFIDQYLTVARDLLFLRNFYKSDNCEDIIRVLEEDLGAEVASDLFKAVIEEASDLLTFDDIELTDEYLNIVDAADEYALDNCKVEDIIEFYKLKEQYLHARGVRWRSPATLNPDHDFNNK